MEETTARRLMAAVRVVWIDGRLTLEMTAPGIRVSYRWISGKSGNFYTAEESVSWEAIKHNEYNPILLAINNLRKQQEIQEHADDENHIAP